jgi:hypothetical protein
VYTSQKPDGLGVAVIPVVVTQIQVTVLDFPGKTIVWQVLATNKYKDPDKAIRNADKEIGQIVKKAMNSFPSRKK